MKVMFFDGYCSLCNGLVDWLIQHGRNSEIKFASLQGATAQSLLPADQREEFKSLETVVYSRDGRIFIRSSAILLSFWDLGGWWRIAAVFILAPVSIRDLVYRKIAENRYELFGRREACRIPLPFERARLLP
jgi:predicted DCC family thiol-disulfide oxidoreductase YuxK